MKCTQLCVQRHIAHGSPTQKGDSVVITQMCISSKMVNGTIITWTWSDSEQNEWPTGTQNNMDESGQHSTEWKTPHCKQFILCNSVLIKFKIGKRHPRCRKPEKWSSLGWVVTVWGHRKDLWNPDLWSSPCPRSDALSLYPFCLSHGFGLALNAGVLWLHLYDFDHVSSARDFSAAATWVNHRNPLRYSGMYANM